MFILVLIMDFFNDDLDVLDIIENGIPRQMYVRSYYLDKMDELTFSSFI